MKRLKGFFIFVIAALFLTPFVSGVEASGVNGAIFTTSNTCDGTNINIYNDQADIYIDGGPAHPGAAGLPNGDYYVKVTDPNGTLLGTSVGSSNEKPVHVTNGEFSTCYQLWSIVNKASDNSQGFDNTSNPGGEYKVWVSTVSTFDNDDTKTDNFKVTETPQNQNGSISGLKWQDTNADGVEDIDEPLLANWGIELWNADHSSLLASTITDAGGFYEFTDVIPNTYQVCEVFPDTTWYSSFPTTSTPNCYTTVTVHANTASNNLNFGNYQYASLTVIKHVINDNGGTNIASDFTMDVNGTNVSNSSFLGDESGVTVSLKPGTYSVTESGPSGYAESDSLACSDDAISGGTYTCTITNDDIAPELTVIKHVENNSAGTKQAKDFTMFVDGTNVSNPSFSGDESGVTITLNAGIYNVTESNALNYTGSLSSECAGTINIGEKKVCTITNTYQPATRTLGFWSTHTSFTTQVANSIGGIVIGDHASHKAGTGLNSTLSNLQSNGKSEFFGAFLANISKKTDGKSRGSVDQSRMILLQQLVAAKLNCALFVCIPSVITTIANADTAYANGNATDILNSAALLNNYNNSNDNAPLGTNEGAATPKTSQSYANLVFWNQP